MYRPVSGMADYTILNHKAEKNVILYCNRITWKQISVIYCYRDHLNHKVVIICSLSSNEPLVRNNRNSTIL
jgi:uncharacterized metal-binding protein